MGSNVIYTKNLTKKYGKKCAVNSISMEIKKGDIYGLIGRNGAGKTSFMRLLLGMTKVTDGSIELLGGTDLENARLKTGSIIETPAFYENMSAYKNMMYRSKLLGMSKAHDKIDELLKLVELYDVKNQKVDDYSLGMRQKLGIATALLNDPELLILDEPINGLDPVAIAEVRKILKKVNKEQGVTILISSHILGEMQKLATRYGFIVNGELVSEISEEEIEAKNIDLESYSLKMMGVSEDE
ncbi:MAG: ATP-binding cassette domain-containing protein [Coprobacillus sp.]